MRAGKPVVVVSPGALFHTNRPVVTFGFASVDRMCSRDLLLLVLLAAVISPWSALGMRAVLIVLIHPI